MADGRSDSSDFIETFDHGLRRAWCPGTGKRPLLFWQKSVFRLSRAASRPARQQDGT
jgi:hypothetical protein